MEKIELRPAYVWTCEECGIDNFENCVVLELSDAEMEELRGEHGIADEDEGVFIGMPDVVTCKACKTTFESEVYKDGIDYND